MIRAPIRIRDLGHGLLDIPDWDIATASTLCILGSNAAGKTTLANLLAGVEHPQTGYIDNLPQRPALLSFESLQAAYEEELANDDTDFIDRIDYGTNAMEILLRTGCSIEEARTTAARFGLSSLLSSGFRQLSTGELRRIHILAAILRNPDLLILDEPYDGIDAAARSQLDQTLQELAASEQTTVLFVSVLADVPSWCGHLALLHSGQIIAQGAAEQMLQNPAVAQLLNPTTTTELPPEPVGAVAPPFNPILRLRKCAVHYDHRTLFEDLNWMLHPGHHTLITGPNGCGKSTLLQLISGDHPQCYSNDIEIFGYQRGSGESIWDIKKHIGMVSPSLHRDYRVAGSLETVVLSGFFDTIGLYHSTIVRQTMLARQWLAFFRMEELASRAFRSLSYGQQRVGLIARSLVKHPPLLILDEPTHGLDDLNRRLVLSCLETLATMQATTLIVVSHRPDERLSLFRQTLRFEANHSGHAQYRILVQTT